MKFEDLLDVYLRKIDHADRMIKNGSSKFFPETKEYWEGYKKSAYMMFQELRLFCEGVPGIERTIPDDGTLLKEYDNCPLVGFMNYRGLYLGVYNDDYGQQEFLVYKNYIISGGAYNFEPQYDFQSQLDYAIDFEKEITGE